MTKPGELLKVHLPGEWPWAIVVKTVSEDIVQAALVNQPVCDDMHSWNYGDIVTFEWQTMKGHTDLFAWESEVEQLEVTDEMRSFFKHQEEMHHEAHLC